LASGAVFSAATGLQSVTMVVRGLATGQAHLTRWWEPLRRQMQTSSILGGVCGVVVGIIGLLWHSPAFGLVVAVSTLSPSAPRGFVSSRPPHDGCSVKDRAAPTRRELARSPAP